MVQCYLSSADAGGPREFADIPGGRAYSRPAAKAPFAQPRLNRRAYVAIVLFGLDAREVDQRDFSASASSVMLAKRPISIIRCHARRAE